MPSKPSTEQPTEADGKTALDGTQPRHQPAWKPSETGTDSRLWGET
ncbi:MAG: hypothetical protein OXF84_05000 [Bacteroidetes bacterium]|nr:hypothetical protein [Bacteroidota bacterium]